MLNPEVVDWDVSVQVHYLKALNAQLTLVLDELADSHKRTEDMLETILELKARFTQLEYGDPNEEYEEEPMEAPEPLAVGPRSPNRQQLRLEE